MGTLASYEFRLERFRVRLMRDILAKPSLSLYKMFLVLALLTFISVDSENFFYISQEFLNCINF